MESSTQMIDFPLPALSLEGFSFGKASPKTIQKWVASLPLGNPKKASVQLYHTLKEFNQIDCSASKRSDISDELLTLSNKLLDTLGRDAELHPFRSQNNDADKLCMAIDWQWLICRLQILKGLTGKSSFLRLNNQSMTDGILDALAQVQTILLRSAMLYMHPPRRTWNLCHQLIQLAHALKVSKDKKTLIKRGKSITTSIEQEYLVCMLFGAARALQLHHKEQGVLLEWLQLLAANTTLSGTPQAGGFFCPLSKDNHAREELLEPDESGYAIYFDTTEINSILTHADDVIPKSSLSDDQYQSLTAHLTECFSGERIRKQNRAKASNQFTAALGLYSVHNHIANGETLESLLIKWKPSPDPVVRKRSRASLEDVWSNAFDVVQPEIESGPMEASESSLKFGQPVKEKNPEERYPKYEIHIIEHSLRGARIAWKPEQASSLKVSEVIGVKDPQAKWRLGVVRWIRRSSLADPTLPLEVGVEWLCQNPTLAITRIQHKSGSEQKYMPALLDRSDPHTSMLIFQGPKPSKGARASLYLDGQEFRIRLKPRKAIDWLHLCEYMILEQKDKFTDTADDNELVDPNNHFLLL